MKSLIGFNLIGGPILFFIGCFVAYLINVPIGLIITIVLLVFGSYTARNYLFSQGRVSRSVALAVNAAALLMSALLLNENYLRIDNFAEKDRAFVAFVGVWLPAIPVIIICITLFLLITHKATGKAIRESE